MAYGTIADILFQWENMGLFDFVLPFLLVFVIVYGIMASTKFLGDNKGVYIVIALVIGLMALRYQYFFSSFLSELFPRLGIGLAILLTILIMVGIFIADTDAFWRYILFAIGAIIAVVVIWQAAERMGWYTGNPFSPEGVGYIVFGALTIGVIVVVVMSKVKQDKGKKVWPKFVEST